MSMYPGLSSSKQLQMPGQMFLTMPVLSQCFKQKFWFFQNKLKKNRGFSFGPFSMDLFLSQLNYGRY